jgi:nitrite reductase (NADH) large subunit
MRRRLLVIGNGMCSLRLLEELTTLAPERFEVTVIGAEPGPAYNRVLLSPLLAGELASDDIELKPASWYAEHGITLRTGAPVTALDTASRTATLGGGERVPFDVCVLATGSEPILLPLPGLNLAGVTTFRSRQDVEAIRDVANGAAAVVIGGGLLGIEAAYGLTRGGAKVTLVHLMARLMERQLDEPAARLLEQALTARGIGVLLGAATRAIVGDGRVSAVELEDGRSIPCDLVVMAVGVRPAAVLAVSAGLEVRRGIVVDDRLATSAAGIYAIGECAEHRGTCYGLIEPGYDQAKVLARRLAGIACRYEGTTTVSSLKVSGIPVVSMGDFEGAGADTILLEDEAAASYRKFVIRDNRLAGLVLFGDTADALWYRDLMRCGVAIAPLRATLAFGKAHAEAA